MFLRSLQSTYWMQSNLWVIHLLFGMLCCYFYLNMGVVKNNPWWVYQLFVVQYMYFIFLRPCSVPIKIAGSFSFYLLRWLRSGGRLNVGELGAETIVRVTGLWINSFGFDRSLFCPVMIMISVPSLINLNLGL